MKKILLSLGMVVFVGVVVAGATGAFFSDTETSTGNTFTAGAIDLQIDNESFLNGVANSDTSWIQKNLESGDFFFNFSDVKPGDFGEDTISIHVNNNDAYACVDVRLDANDDNGLTEPEEEDGDSTGGDGQGELASHIKFLWWVDDGDNVLESDESTLPAGPLAPTLSVGDVATVALAEPSGGGVFGGALPGDTVVHLAKAWCFGNISANPLSPSNYSGPDNPANAADTSKVTPEDGGFSCSGASSANNITQTDSFEATISFFAVQARNNDSFSCQPHLSGGEQRPTVGANLLAYSQSQSCTTNVTDINGDGEIQTAIDAASNGDIICVGPGTYNEDVVIDKEITLSGDGASATSVINGQAGGQGAAVRIAANNVTLEGFQINGAGIAALWLNTSVSGATVRFNKITSASGGVTALTTQGFQANSTFSNNEFVGTGSGQVVYVNGTASLSQASDNVDFLNNTFSGTIVSGGVALGNESTNSDITENKFASTLTSTYAIAETWEDDANINFNNFNGVGDIKVRNGDSSTVDAENNWWGAAVPAGHTSGLVDDDPKESSAFPQN